MGLHLYQRTGESPHWQALVRVGGKRYRFSCKTSDKVTARKYAQKRVDELEERHNRGLVGLPDPVRMSEVFERYEREYAPNLRPSARKRMLDVVKQARRWFVDGPLHDPQVQRVQPGDCCCHRRGVLFFLLLLPFLLSSIRVRFLLLLRVCMRERCDCEIGTRGDYRSPLREGG
jgi:hypothetical protein